MQGWSWTLPAAAAGELEGRGAGGVRGPVLEAGALRLRFPGPPREAGILLNFTKKPTPREGWELAPDLLFGPSLSWIQSSGLWTLLTSPLQR